MLYRFWFAVLIVAALLAGCRGSDTVQAPPGEWRGILEVPAFRQAVTVVVPPVSGAPETVGVVLAESPDDTVTATVETWSAAAVRFEAPRRAIFFQGRLEPDNATISGRFIRGRTLMPLALRRAGEGRGGAVLWSGDLDYAARRIGIVLDVAETWWGWGDPDVTVSSPDLNVQGIPVEPFELYPENTKMRFRVPLLDASFSGRYHPEFDAFAGQWRFATASRAIPVQFDRVVARPYTYRPPQALPDGWAVSDLEAESIDTERVAALVEAIERGDYPGMHSLLIVRNGRLVLERYFNGYRRDVMQDLGSVTMSVTAMLTGSALRNGFLASLDEPVVPFFTRSDTIANMDGRKAAMTVADLLTMRSGLACNDWSTTAMGTEEKLMRGRDWVGLTIDLPMSAAPGERWQHCTGSVILLGALLEYAAGERLPQFAQRHLFDPLGIAAARWHVSPEGQTNAGGALLLTPRDMARLGQLMVENGEWGGTRLLPEDFARRAVQPLVETEGSRIFSETMGYLWWTDRYPWFDTEVDVFFAAGNGGQFIFGIPELGLVVVMTGGNYDDPLTAQPIRMLRQHLLKAVK